MKYTYGTSNTAAKRLKEIAMFFNPLSQKFISQFNTGNINSALDIGCGPGFTTDMLSKAANCSNVYGIDQSNEFIEMAAKRYTNYTFIKHDVTKSPFPVRTELMYARLLLSHLKDVITLINRWMEELKEKGKLIIEEVEDIDTNILVFKKYLKIGSALIASQGTTLFVGNILSKGHYNANVLCNECFLIPVPNYKAATWFFPNTITIWKQEKYIKENFSLKEKNEISKELFRIKESNDSRTGITWKIRRLVLKKKYPTTVC